MKTIEKIYKGKLPLEWVNLDYFPESKAQKKEIYLIESTNIIEDLIFLFYTLFGKMKNDILIYDKSWWDFSLDTWDPNKDAYNYDLKGKSSETKEYLNMLKSSEIEVGYFGSCKCINWDNFLQIILKCIVSHKAPYSQIFYNKENNFFFYFHHSGSIGFFYQKNNELVNQIINTANEKFDVRGF